MIENILTPVVRELGLYILLRATVIMAMVAALTFKLKKSSASVRYTLWSAAFFMLIILPIVSYTVPSWTVFEIDGPVVTVPVYSDDGMMGDSFKKTEMDNNGKAGTGNSSKTESVNSEHTAIMDSGEAGRVKRIGQKTDTPAAAPANTSRPASRDVKVALSRIFIVALFSIWLLVAAVLLSRFLMQLLEVGGITRRAIRVEGGRLGSEIRNLIASLDIRRPVRVMLSEEVSMPFAWGLFRPVIVLPIDAGEWPEDRIRSVMTHELAHIARWDYLIHMVIEMVRIVYWPNPIVWFAARKCVMERERACDDFALRDGTPSEDYASHLLHIARVQIEGRIPVPAVTMAGEPGLKERIGYVMNGKMNRSPMQKGMLVITTALIVLIVLPLGSMAIRTNRWIIPDTKGLVRQLSERMNPADRSMAAWWLGEHETKKAVYPLVDALTDDARIVRLTSAWALGEIKDRDSIDGLIETLETDQDLLVREMAVLALGEIEDPSAVEALKDAYESDERLALAVVWALGEIARRNGDDADDLRDEIMDNLGKRHWKNEEVWTGTLKRKLRRSRDVENLIENLVKGDEDNRLEAAFNLGVLGIKQDFETTNEVESAVGALIAALEDPAAEVRAMAIWALDEINPSRKKAGYSYTRKRRDTY
ncbi:MAG: HEAT repeat domain-containing protein [bacterium]|nr:MAG: HEAT repeat domain-containing protein [bacterium]